MPSSDYLFVLIDANSRTGVRMGEEDCKVIGSYGRDTRVSDSNETSLLRFAGDNKLALVNTFFSVPKRCTSRTFNGTRPADRKRVTRSTIGGGGDVTICPRFGLKRHEISSYRGHI